MQLILFYKFQATPHVLTQAEIGQYLQDTDIHMATSTRTALERMDSSFLTIPEQVQPNTIIACVASKSSQDRYWIAQILEVQSEDPNVYKVRFYDWSVNQRSWTLQRGKRAHGSCPHDSVILLGVQFNLNGSLTAATVNHLNFVLQKYNL